MELEILSMNSRSDMMNLRIECSPRKCQGSCGAPVFLIPRSVLNNLVEEGFTVREMSMILSVSRTVYRRMRSYGICKIWWAHWKNSQRIPLLWWKPYKAFRDSIHRVDHDLVNLREKGRLHRRVYNVNKRSVLRRQSMDTNRNIKRSVYCQCG